MNSPIPTIGAYFRMSAWRLIFLAAFLYFADSERSDVERWDIPIMSACSSYLPSMIFVELSSRETEEMRKRGENHEKLTHGPNYLHAIIDPPYSSS